MVLLHAVRGAQQFVESVRGPDGAYDITDWPPVRRRRIRNIETTVARLRMGQRSLMGFLDPVEDALFLVAGLRNMGIAASFHLGRELAPTSPVAGFFAWVEYEGRVLSTSLPVQETYVRVHRSDSR